MLSITDGGSLARALKSPIDARVKRLLTTRRNQLGLDKIDQAHFVLVQPGDTPTQLQLLLSFSVFQNLGDGSKFGDPDFTPGWEWIEDHGFAYELVFILDDSGYAHVVVLPKSEGIDEQLTALCEAYANESV